MLPRRLLVLLFVCTLVALTFATGAAEGEPARRGAADPRIAAAGDIACKDPPRNNRRVCRYDDVAALVAAGDYDRFLALGDDQYEYGRLKDFRENYDVYFGDLMDITAPVPGNHEYGTPDAAGYFRYFGARAHGPGGYYSFDLGAWHLIALNSANCPAAVGCGPGDPQFEWLKADLAGNDAACTLAYWHHPRYDWLKYQHADWTENYEFLRSAPFWNLLYAGDAPVLAECRHVQVSDLDSAMSALVARLKAAKVSTASEVQSELGALSWRVRLREALRALGQGHRRYYRCP